MIDIIGGILKITLGGFAAYLFGAMLIHSIFNKKVRDDFLNDLNPRKPTIFERLGYAIMAISMVIYASWAAFEGATDLIDWAAAQ